MTVRLSSSSDTIILQTPPVPPRVSQPDPPYERVFLLDPQYQDPAALRNKLPEVSQSAEASGEWGKRNCPGVKYSLCLFLALRELLPRLRGIRVGLHRIVKWGTVHLLLIDEQAKHFFLCGAHENSR